jgi:hypothetical protein
MSVRSFVVLFFVAAGLILGVGAQSAAGPPTLSFGPPTGVDWPVEAGGYGDVGEIAIGELTGDGRPDLAIASPLDGLVSTVINLGHGRLEDGEAYQVASFESRDLERVAIADLNGDGKRDLVTTKRNQVVAVLLNRGRGDFSPPVEYPTGRAPAYPALAVGDLNGDGKPDVVTTTVRSVLVLFANGDGTLRTPVAYPTAVQPFDVQVGDLNGDGKLDVVTANYLAHTVSTLINTGDGTLEAGADYTTGGFGGAPYKLALADLNGDNELDVVTGNQHHVSLLFNRGAGLLAPPRMYGGDLLDVADMNADGRPDLVGGGDIRLNRGDGTFEPPLIYFYPDAVGDLNRDGRPDLLFPTFNDRNGQWSLWVRLDNLRACNVQPTVGKRLAIARQILVLANCRVGRLSYAHSRSVKRGQVISQKPASYTVKRKGARVDLVISLGRH